MQTKAADRGYWSHRSREKGSWRWWLHKRSHGSPVLTANVSWRARLTGVWLGRNDDGEWHTAIGVYWAYASLGWRTPWARRGNYGEGREMSLTFHDRAVWWHVWVNRDCWESSRPKWRDGNFHPVDALFGRENCTRRTIEERNVLVPMPEKAYPAKAQLVEFTWKRPRWPFAKTMLRVNIDIPGGIPHAGKGENSWDCGDDGTFGLTTGECKSIPEGVGILVGSCLRTRVRYGGWDDWSWKRDDAN